jgi:DNA mismatch repair ATPase MutS
LHVEIRRLTKELVNNNEGYEHQIEVAFELQEQLTTSKTMLVSLTEAKRVQHEKCTQLTDELAKQQHNLAAVQAELVATLQADHKEQATNLVVVEQALQQYQKASHDANPATPRSAEGTPHASGSNTQTDTSAFYLMVKGAVSPTKCQHRSMA